MQEGNLHKWFKGSKSKDGKGGWVNVVTGGTCASDEPGEGTPKCVSSSKRASMTPAERKSAQRRKKAADPNQQQKSGAAKPTYVSTDKPKKKMKKEEAEVSEATYPSDFVKGSGVAKKKTGRPIQHDQATDKQGRRKTIDEAKDKPGKGSGKKDACYKKVKASASVWPSAYASGRLVQCRKKGAANYGKSKKNEEFLALPEFTESQINSMRKAGIEVEVVDEACWKGYEKTRKEEYIDEDSRRMSNKQHTKRVKQNIKSFGSNFTPPNNWDPDANRGQGEVVTRKQMEKKRRKSLRQEEVEHVDEACWKTHEQRGMKKKGGKMVPNCVPKGSVREQVIAKLKGELPLKDAIEESVRVPAQTGNVYAVAFTWRGKYMMMKLFFPEVKKPSRSEVQDALAKVYPGCMVQRFDLTTFQPTDAVLNVGVKEGSELKYCPKCKKLETRSDCAYGGSYWDENAKEVSTDENGSMEVSEAAWQRKEGKNPSGGLNEKGRKSYERENPGSDLKAPQPEGGPRKRSFCARMGGMKGPMKDEKGRPTRKALALRKWKC